MNKNRRQAHGKNRIGKDKKPTSTHSLQSSVNNLDQVDKTAQIRSEQTARGWQGWLKKQPTPQTIPATEPKSEIAMAEQDVMDIHATLPSIPAPPSETAQIPSSEHDESKDIHPLPADVLSERVETRKEENMQTAKQEDSATDSPAKVDLRDNSSSKVNAFKEAAKTQSDDGIGSLFGPVIEDDAKGVRNQIRELIQCEMQGELGQRFSRNLRIVIRREIAAAIDDQFDRV